MPDGYEVKDAKLDDIKFNLRPEYTPELVAKLDSTKLTSRSLEGAEFITGVVGLNNLKRTEFANCVIQMLARVGPLKELCLLSKNDSTNMLGCRFDELIKKIWNPKNFKGHVSPSEFMV